MNITRYISSLIESIGEKEWKEDATKNHSGAMELKRKIESLGEEYVVNIEVASGKSAYLTVSKRPSNAAGKILKNRNPVPLQYKARFADHGSYWGATVSVDKYSGNTVETAFDVFRYIVGLDKTAPKFNVAKIDPSSGETTIYSGKLTRTAQAGWCSSYSGPGRKIVGSK